MTWKKIIDKEKKKSYFRKLELFITGQYQNTLVYPPKDKIFTAFDLTTYDSLKVVILGQDPYHQKDQAQAWHFLHQKR